jgi:hypothetical protein
LQNKRISKSPSTSRAAYFLLVDTEFRYYEYIHSSSALILGLNLLELQFSGIIFLLHLIYCQHLHHLSLRT